MKKIYILSLIILFGIQISQSQTALEFDGDDDYVQTTFPGVFGTTPRTFQAWIYLSEAPTSNKCITDYGLNAVGSRNTFMVNGNGYLAYISGGTNANITATDTTVPIGSWVHVAFVYDGTDGYFYQDGMQVGTGSLTTVNTPSTGGDLRIGERVSGGSILFEGKIDEVSIWDIDLSEEEITTYSCINGDPALIDNLVAYFDFNDGSGTTLTELVDGNDGALNSMSEDSWVESDICIDGPKITFVVTDTVTYLPVENALIVLDEDSVFTNSSGEAFFFVMEESTYNYQITNEDYYDYSGEVTVMDTDTIINIDFAPIIYYSINFVVTDYYTGDPINNADVNVLGDIESTNSDGEVSFTDLLPGNYPYNITKSGYFTETGSVDIINQNVTIEAAMMSDETFTVSFIISNLVSGANVEGAMIDLDGEISYTNQYGVATFPDLLQGTYSYDISADGYASDTGNVEVIGQNVVVQVELTPYSYSVTLVVIIEPVGDFLENAEIDLDGTVLLTDEYGEAIFENIYAGVYSYIISHSALEGPYEGEVEVINENVTEEVEIWITTIDNIDLEDFKIYPNPSNGQFTVENQQVETDLEIFLINSTGTEVFRKRIENRTETINVSDQPTGFYILKIKSDNEIIHHRIIIE